MSPTAVRLRSVWFQIHKWVGILLAILVIPIALSGAALVWHDWLDEQINPQRYPEVTAPLLEPSVYARAAASVALQGERVAAISLPDGEGAVQVILTKPLPEAGRRSTARVRLDPGTAEPIERAGSREGVLSVIHVLHGSLMVPGVGRKIVGWVGVRDAAVVADGPVAVVAAERQRAPRTEMEPQAGPEFESSLPAGFWVSLPLAVLSLTGMWISFPGVFNGARGGPPGTGPRVVERTNLAPEQALAAAHSLRRGTPRRLGGRRTKAPNGS